MARTLDLTDAELRRHLTTLLGYAHAVSNERLLSATAVLLSFYKGYCHVCKFANGTHATLCANHPSQGSS